MQEKKKQTRSIDGVIRRQPAVFPLRHRRAFKAASALIIVGLIIYSALQVASFLTQQQIDRSKYQAVYLISGQIYFGKLVNKSGDYLTLNSAYTVQQSSGDKSSDGTTTVQQEAATSIVKVSQQAYGPNDTIALKGEQVLFWQNLRDDSKIVQAIKTGQ